MSKLPFLSLAKMWWDREVDLKILNYKPFPRDLGEERYYPRAIDYTTYYNYIMKQIKFSQNAFVDFYSDKERQEHKTFRLFIDVDRYDRWEEMKLFLFTFWDNIDVFYSGAKGFHVYIYINPETSKDLPFNDQRNPNYIRLRRVISTWIQSNVDSRTFLDFRRLNRIPFTKHPKTGRWKIPVSLNWSIEEIEQKASHPENYTEDFFAFYNKQREEIEWQTFLQNPIEFMGLKE